MSPLQNDKQFQMRTSEEFLARLDAWRRNQPDLPGRSEAIRRLVDAALTAEETSSNKGKRK